jgi:hypothetical protein
MTKRTTSYAKTLDKAEPSRSARPEMKKAVERVERSSSASTSHAPQAAPAPRPMGPGARGVDRENHYRKLYRPQPLRPTEKAMPSKAQRAAQKRQAKAQFTKSQDRGPAKPDLARE